MDELRTRWSRGDQPGTRNRTQADTMDELRTRRNAPPVNLLTNTLIKEGSLPMKTTKSRAQEVDRYVGARIRERRIMLGLTQQQLADMIGVTYQQAHKYERGINRIAAGRLYDIAQALGVTISYFFEGLEQGGQVEMTPRQRMCLELARNFSMIQNGKHQEALSTLARSLADAS